MCPHVTRDICIIQRQVTGPTYARFKAGRLSGEEMTDDAEQDKQPTANGAHRLIGGDSRWNAMVNTVKLLIHSPLSPNLLHNWSR